MIVGICGIGFVGGALMNSFEKLGLTYKAYDKYKNIGSFDELLDCGIIFLCLPTLYCDNKKEYDKCALHEICDKLVKSNYKGLVVLKSTVEPGTTETLYTKYGLHLAHNPEFLTARTANIDFHEQKHIVLGKIRALPNDVFQKLNIFYKTHYPKAEISLTTSDQSEAMKIFCNSFYATKVQFFNEIYEYCGKKKIDYDDTVGLMLKNGWINPMHTKVPGPDGKLGFGGACFPKDTRALNEDMKRHNSTNNLLENVVVSCNKMRKD